MKKTEMWHHRRAWVRSALNKRQNAKVIVSVKRFSTQNNSVSPPLHFVRRPKKYILYPPLYYAFCESETNNLNINIFGAIGINFRNFHRYSDFVTAPNDGQCRLFRNMQRLKGAHRYPMQSRLTFFISLAVCVCVVAYFMCVYFDYYDSVSCLISMIVIFRLATNHFKLNHNVFENSNIPNERDRVRDSV